MVKSRWWADWTFNRIDETLSILDVFAWREMDFKLAGLLWLLMEKRPSLLVAAAPSYAGKTTLFHALLDFLPPDVSQVTLRGYYEDFKNLGTDKPEKTYLITEEISNHSYEYLWGYQVVRAFDLVQKGYALGGTIHARNLREVAYLLNALNVPLRLIGSLGLVVTLQVKPGRYYDDDYIRYVDTVSTLNLTEDGLTAQILAQRHLPDDDFIYPPEDALRTTLAAKFGIENGPVGREIERRGSYLSQLYSEKHPREEVRQAIRKFYRLRNRPEQAP